MFSPKTQKNFFKSHRYRHTETYRQRKYNITDIQAEKIQYEGIRIRELPALKVTIHIPIRNDLTYVWAKNSW